MAQNWIRRMLNPPDSDDKKRSNSSKFLIDLASGGLAAAVAKTSVAPIERVKLLLQIQQAQVTIENPYRGIFDVFKRVPMEQGALSFWRGNLANVVRYFPTQALNFAFRDTYKRVLFHGVDKKEQFWKYFAGSMVSGGLAGATSLTVVYPLDFVRTRLAMDVGKDSTREFTGIANCISKIAKTDGIRGLYRGYLVSIQGIMIYRAFYSGFYDAAKALYANRAADKEGKQKPLNFFQSWMMERTCTSYAQVMGAPWDTIRRRMMMQSGRGEVLYKNSLDCLMKTVRGEGLRALYKGSLTNIYRGTGGALVLAFYEEMQKWL